MKNRKKLIVILALTALMVAALCASAFAAEAVDSGQCGENVYWELDSDGVLTISGTGKMWNWNILDYIYAPWDNHRSDIKSINISNSVTTIGSSAFYYCTSLTSVTIPNSVTTIGDYAFYNCTSLTSVTIPNSVTTIGDDAFWYCTSLTSVTIPDSVTTIGACAFSDCESLTSVTIPDSVTTIGVDAFRFCTSLTSVTIPNSVTTIGSRAFSYCTSLTSVTIPNSVTTIGAWAFSHCTSLKGIWVDENNPNYSSDSFGVLFNKNKSELIQAPGAITEYSIPDSVTTIGYHGAFEYCESLTSVTIPNSVTTIGGCAFADCTSLTSVTIPNSVTTIGDSTFSHCTSLTSVTIPDSVTTIDVDAFEDCTSLTSVTIPNSVTTIGAWTFYWCTSLTSVTIGDGVTTIDDFTFDGCTSLKDIYYAGSEDDWNKIEIGVDNECLTNATIHYNSISSEIGGKIETLLSTNSAEYNHDLAVICAELSDAAYSDSGAKVREYLGNNLFLNKDIKSYNYDPLHSHAFVIGTKPYIRDESGNTDIIVIVARGTENIREKIGDVMSTTDKEVNGYYVYDIVYDFYSTIYNRLEKIIVPEKKYKILLTGHSLGGATTNLLASMLTNKYGSDNVFCYTFGAIDCITMEHLISDGYKNIHNIYNNFDTFAPKQYGFILLTGAGRKYGKFGVMDEFTQEYRTSKEMILSLKDQVSAHINHKIENYIEAVKNEEPEKFKKKGGRYSYVGCPVNIDVYCENKIVGRVVNGTVDDTVTSINIVSEGDIKYVFYPDNRRYDLRITAYDEGTMVYFTCDTDSYDSMLKTDIELTVGKSFISSVGGNIDTVDVQMYVADENGKPISEVMDDGSELRTNFIFGDLDGDNAITNADLVTLARYVVEISDLSDAQKYAADMNRDTNIDNTDLVTVARMIVGL